MVTAQPGSGAQAQQLVLDAEPGQPVGEVADRLVVVEVGLADPALGPRAAHHEAALAVGFDGEAALVHRNRPEHRAARHDRRLRGAVRRHHVPQRERQRPQPFPADRGHLDTPASRTAG